MLIVLYQIIFLGLDGKDPTSPKTQRENKKNLRDSFLKQDDNHSQNSEEPSPHYSQKFTFQNQSFVSYFKIYFRYKFAY